MKKIIVILLAVSCSTSQSLETRAKNYMKDSVVNGFNDPKSYEFVSIKTDTILRPEYDTAKVEENYNAEIKMIAESIGDYKPKEKYYDSLRALLRADKKDPKEICELVFNVDFRSKNIMDAIELNHYQLVLNKFTNKIKVK